MDFFFLVGGADVFVVVVVVVVLVGIGKHGISSLKIFPIGI